MNSHNLGFVSSWKMLTRDKGWIKPVLVLTLVGMIPLVGQIAVLGYALEWARLTAWGIDSAPKQRGVDYGKVLSTGLRAFGVSFTMALVIGLILEIVFPGALLALSQAYAFGGSASAAAVTALGSTFTVAMMAIMMVTNSFILAAAMRATLYDSFAAGWRIDRLCQMIARDLSGFFKTFLVVLIGMLISFAYAFVITIVAVFVIAGGAIGASAVMATGGFADGTTTLSNLLTWGAGPLLLLSVLGLGVMFVASVIGTVMNLIAVNAMGQWFCRFEVSRWGQSGDPLPDGVPRKDAQASAPTPVSGEQPTPETSAAPQQDAPVAPASDSSSSSAEGSAATVPPMSDGPVAESSEQPVDHPVHESAQEPASPVVPAPWSEVVGEQEAPVSTDEPEASDNEVLTDVPDESAAPAVVEEAVEAPTAPAPWDIAFAAAQAEVTEKASDAASESERERASVVDEDEAGATEPSQPGAEPSGPVKQPIPLGPISTSDDKPEEGPIDA